MKLELWENSLTSTILKFVIPSYSDKFWIPNFYAKSVFVPILQRENKNDF